MQQRQNLFLVCFNSNGNVLLSALYIQKFYKKISMDSAQKQALAFPHKFIFSNLQLVHRSDIWKTFSFRMFNFASSIHLEIVRDLKQVDINLREEENFTNFYWSKRINEFLSNKKVHRKG